MLDISGENLINIDNYLTIEAIEDGLTASLSVNACEYCVDGDGNWKTLSAGTTTESINSGQTLSFRGNLIPQAWEGIGTFIINKKCNLKGNCMAILFADNVADNYSLDGKDYAFYRLFQNCTNIVNVDSNFLPATTLASNCYSSMFYGCTNLTTSPELPATTLAYRCYYGMFAGTDILPDCSNIDFASSTVVASRGLSGLFYGTKVTDNDLERLLPKNNNGRFYLPVTTLADSCYYCMFYGCTNLTTAPKLPATTLASNCYSSMFYGCTNLTTSPELPATTLAYRCYYGMFAGTDILPDCSNIDFASSTVVASRGLSGLFYGTKVTDNDLERLLPKNNNGRFYLPVTTLADSCYYCMFYGCTNLTTAPKLPATTLASNCYNGMFQNCTNLTTPPELPATTLASDCYSSMFYGCTNLTTAPELPATSLVDSCYYSIFYSCNKLNYIKMLATDISAFNCLNTWVYNVSSTGTFIKNAAMSNLPTGSSGIPDGWTVQNA